VDPRAGMDRWEELAPHRHSIPGPSSPYRVAVPTELSRPTLSDSSYRMSLDSPLTVAVEPAWGRPLERPTDLPGFYGVTSVKIICRISFL
jgi:hypothetical protein